MGAKVLVNVRALPDARSRSGVNGEAEFFARSVKPFGGGRPVCGGRGHYANSIVGKDRFKPRRSCIVEHSPSRREPRNWQRRAWIGRTDVEETARKNLFCSEAEGCEAPRHARESWMEGTEFMRLAASWEESEIGFRQP